jgi:hypothetical protein
MAELWPLPDLMEVKNNDSEWLLRLLEGKPETIRVMILMTLWRIWHYQNEIIHQKPAPPIESSRRFLCSYVESILTIKQFPNADPTRGKTVVSWDVKDISKGKKSEEKKTIPRPWRNPPEQCVKLNVDGSFCGVSSRGGI